ncbi:MAG: DMT family transporter [Halioglobus sp.]|nr:DMT family transporter [Halioglobus sp.]
MQTNWKLGLAFTLVTVLMWGLLPLALTAVLDAMDPITISWYRFAVSAAIALAWYGHRSGAALRRMILSWPLVLTAAGGLTGNYIFYILGLERTTPGAAQLLIQVAPLFLLLGSVWLLGERLSGFQWLGVGVLLAGMLLFFHSRIVSTTATSDTYVTGVLMLIAAAVLWALYGLAQKQLLGKFHAREILFMLCLGGTLLLLPLSEPRQVLSLDGVQLAVLGFAGLNTIIAYGAFGLAMSHWQASRVSAIIPLAPLLTLLFTEAVNRSGLATIPAEPLDWLSSVGALLVVVGAALAALPGGQRD